MEKEEFQRQLTLVHAVVSKPAFRQTVTTTYCEEKKKREREEFGMMQGFLDQSELQGSPSP